jgi:hypothetical protein
MYKSPPVDQRLTRCVQFVSPRNISWRSFLILSSYQGNISQTTSSLEKLRLKLSVHFLFPQCQFSLFHCHEHDDAKSASYEALYNVFFFIPLLRQLPQIEIFSIATHPLYTAFGDTPLLLQPNTRLVQRNSTAVICGLANYFHTFRAVFVRSRVSNVRSLARTLLNALQTSRFLQTAADSYLQLRLLNMPNGVTSDTEIRITNPNTQHYRNICLYITVSSFEHAFRFYYHKTVVSVQGDLKVPGTCKNANVNLRLQNGKTCWMKTMVKVIITWHASRAPPRRICTQGFFNHPV